MILEKATAITEAQIAAAAKLLAGRGANAATKSAAGVYRRKVRANRRRLVRR